MEQRSWRRMAAIDASWHGVDGIRVLWDVDLPDQRRLRDSFARHVELCEPIRREYRVGKPQWRPVPVTDARRWADAMCLFTDEDSAGIEGGRRAQLTPLGHLPLRMIIGPRSISIRMSHAVGDGWSAMSLLSSVLAGARSGRAELEMPWTVVRPSRRVAHSVSALAAHPRQSASIFRDRSSYRGGEQVEMQAQESSSTDYASEAVRSDTRFVARVRSWRDAQGVDASVASIVLWAVRRSFSTALYEPQPGAEIVFNTRKADHATARAFGNWSAAAYLPDSMDSPAQVRAAIAEAQRRGLPHAAVAGAFLRGLRQRTTDDTKRAVSADTVAPRLTLSYLRSTSDFAAIEQAAGSDFHLSVFSTPNGISAITVAATEMADRLHLNVNYYARRWPPEMVRAAMDTFLSMGWMHELTADSSA